MSPLFREPDDMCNVNVNHVRKKNCYDTIELPLPFPNKMIQGMCSLSVYLPIFSLT